MRLPLARQLARSAGMKAEGLESVFLANRDALQRFLRARCGDPSDAEDYLQELWLKLSKANGPIVEPLGYLYRMADNLVLDRRRSTQRRVRRDDAWGDLAGSGSNGVSDMPSPEREAIAKSQLAQVSRAFDALGERTTTIFKSYRMDGEGQRDIAERHGISLSTVEKHLQKAYRAVLQIRDKLDTETDATDLTA
jgi:RNA polymerase sigma factor (sigma-70 family)